MSLTIVARITAVAGKESLVRTELERLVETTRAEPGCQQYDLHVDNTDPTVFLFHENWDNRELWQAHMNAPHIAAFGAATQGSIADFQLHEMTRIA